MVFSIIFQKSDTLVISILKLQRSTHRSLCTGTLDNVTNLIPEFYSYIYCRLCIFIGTQKKDVLIKKHHQYNLELLIEAICRRVFIWIRHMSFVFFLSTQKNWWHQLTADWTWIFISIHCTCTKIDILSKDHCQFSHHQPKHLCHTYTHKWNNNFRSCINLLTIITGKLIKKYDFEIRLYGLFSQNKHI